MILFDHPARSGRKTNNLPASPVRKSNRYKPTYRTDISILALKRFPCRGADGNSTSSLPMAVLKQAEYLFFFLPDQTIPEIWREEGNRKEWIFTRDALLSFDWEISIGDVTLSLMNLRNSWTSRCPYSSDVFNPVELNILATFQAVSGCEIGPA